MLNQAPADTFYMTYFLTALPNQLFHLFDTWLVSFVSVCFGFVLIFVVVVSFLCDFYPLVLIHTGTCFKVQTLRLSDSQGQMDELQKDQKKEV